MTALSPPTTQWIEKDMSMEDIPVVDMVVVQDETEAENGNVRESMDTIDDDFLPIQQHSRPATPDDVAFERDVLILSGGKTEEELNKHYRHLAIDLGLEGERKPSKGSLDQNDVADSSLTVASSVRNSLSQTSQSTAPTSCDSSERQNYQTYPNLQPKIAQALAPEAQFRDSSRGPSQRFSSRPPSVLSSRSISSSIKSGWRRISGLSKRRPSDIPSSTSTPSIFSQEPAFDYTTSRSSIVTSRPTTSHRPSTSRSSATAKTSNSRPQSTATRPPSIATSFTSYHDNVPAILSPRSSRTGPSLSRGKSLPSIASGASSTHKNFSIPFSATPRSRSSGPDPRIEHRSHARALSPTREEGFSHSAELKAAQARTARNRDLQRLRASQFAEQARFLSFQSDQAARISARHHERLRAHRKLWTAKEMEMEKRHATRETETEARQLGAELDLERALEAEKRTVEARLRHMEGYVSGRGMWDNVATATSPVKDAGEALHLSVMSQFPKREVSTHSFQMLNQQRRLRKQLPQLHTARINVLREQQAKKLEKLQAKQAEEWDALVAEKDDAEDGLRGRLRVEEEELKREFEKRKERMEWRWKVTEELERRRLQEERGVLFAETQKVRWSPNAWRGNV